MNEIPCGMTQCPDNNTTRHSFLSNLVGPSNEGDITVCGINTTGLVDSGSMVSCVSECFYYSIDPKPVLHQLSDFNLDVYSAGGINCLI